MKRLGAVSQMGVKLENKATETMERLSRFTE